MYLCNLYPFSKKLLLLIYFSHSHWLKITLSNVIVTFQDETLKFFKMAARSCTVICNEVLFPKKQNKT